MLLKAISQYIVLLSIIEFKKGNIWDIILKRYKNINTIKSNIKKLKIFLRYNEIELFCLLKNSEKINDKRNIINKNILIDIINLKLVNRSFILYKYLNKLIYSILILSKDIMASIDNIHQNIPIINFCLFKILLSIYENK